MSKKVSILTTIALMFLAAVVTFQITFVAVSSRYSKLIDEGAANLQAYDKLAEIDAYYRKYYIGEIDEEQLMDGIMDGYIYGTGDKYAYYLDKKEYADFKLKNEGKLVGIGVIVIYSEPNIEISYVMPNSPAEEAGLTHGDVITHVEGESVAELGYSVAVDKVLGEEGTEVSITIERDGASKDVSIVRRKITSTSVISHALEGDKTIGVVRIIEFNDGTPAQFIEACDTLMKNGATRFVFDVRNNSGGDLYAICEILDYLLPEGPIVRFSSEAVSTINSDAAHLDVPMCVLVNGNTASAAELFASALQDYKVAELVGTTTYGKGTMQSIIALSDGTGFGISTSMYYPPFSEGYEGIGVIPDHHCEMDEALAEVNIYKLTDKEDNQLQYAVKVLKGEIAE